MDSFFDSAVRLQLSAKLVKLNSSSAGATGLLRSFHRTPASKPLDPVKPPRFTRSSVDSDHHRPRLPPDDKVLCTKHLIGEPSESHSKKHCDDDT